jgi:hypothetical protein
MIIHELQYEGQGFLRIILLLRVQLNNEILFASFTIVCEMNREDHKNKSEEIYKIFWDWVGRWCEGFYWTVKEGREAVQVRGPYIVVLGR